MLGGRLRGDRVRSVESDVIVVRRSYAETPQRVEYGKTPKGQALLPIVAEMRRFGHEWLGCPAHPVE